MSEIILWIFAIIGMLTVGVGLIALVVNLFSCWIGRGDNIDSFLKAHNQLMLKELLEMQSQNQIYYSCKETQPEDIKPKQR